MVLHLKALKLITNKVHFQFTAKWRLQFMSSFPPASSIRSHLLQDSLHLSSPRQNTITVRYIRPSATTEHLSEDECISVNGRSALQVSFSPRHPAQKTSDYSCYCFSILAQFNPAKATKMTRR